MCGLMAAVAVAQFAVGAASAVSSYQGQQAQHEYQQAQYEMNRKAANQAAVNQYEGQQRRILQERKASSAELQSLGIEAMRGRSTAEVAAGEAGVTGLSVDALISDYYGQEGRHARVITNNSEMTTQQLRDDMKGIEAQTAARINSVPQGIKPSFADAAVRLMGAGVNAFGGYASAPRRK